ncbi:MAG: hypothetical protein ACJ8AG_09600 [Ktedonobacteraceae bacterium]
MGDWLYGGEFSGRLFPLTEQEQLPQHPMPVARRVTVLQEA